MDLYLLLIGAVILSCILFSRLLRKIPLPSLLIFIALGMLLGENGILGITFNNYSISNAICSVSLIFIMFYGGFGTNLSCARPVLLQAGVMSTLGVVFTAFLVGAFGYFVLGCSWLESLLIGSVISSTDAASVFNILRSKKLSLKYHTDSLLEVESGSNDPVSYMMTAILLTLLSGQEISIPLMFAKQIGFGIVCGLLIGKLAVLILNSSIFTGEHERTVLAFSVAVLAYALPSALGGNGYLSVYLCGIFMGNSALPQKRYLVHFFDVLTDVAQVLIFFLLGLLVTPLELPAVAGPALLLMLFLTFIARPLVSAVLLGCFRARKEQIGVVSWAGLRGAASIVFAIMAVLQGAMLRYDLFNLVFCIVLFSIAFQGTLLPWISRKLGMIDETSDVRKTFTDYQEESDINFVKITIGNTHPWKGKRLREILSLKGLLVVMILRGEKTLVPHGETRVCEGDILVLAAREFEGSDTLELREISVDRNHKWNGKRIQELNLPSGSLIVMIQRKNQTIIPRGNTLIKEQDVLVEADIIKP